MAKERDGISPLLVFFLYIAAAFICICGYRYFFPANQGFMEILDRFKLFWLLSGGMITFIDLFPALAFSGLVIPFGLKEHSEGGYAGSAYIGKKGFSLIFFKYLSIPVITAFTAAVLYGLLFFLALPLTMSYRNTIIDQSQLFGHAKTTMEKKAEENKWDEVSYFAGICEKIWPGNKEIESFKEKNSDSIRAYHSQSSAGRNKTPADENPVWAGIPGDPLTSSEALILAEEAFDNERYYDSHWLAVLADRLAQPGSIEKNSAVAMASRAWEKISALGPNELEKDKFSLFTRKREAYEAMNDRDYVSAFYGFLELSALTPDDPDVEKYLDLCKTGVAETAFFIDELDLSIGTTMLGPVFSLPTENDDRIVLRFDTLALSKNSAYVHGAELVAVDAEGRFLLQINSDYAKLISFIARDKEDRSADKTVLLLRALDRNDKNHSSEPVIRSDTHSRIDPVMDINQIMLNISFNDFVLLANMNQGIETLNLRDLFTAEKTFGDYGFVRESFGAEILNRMGNTLFFLPMTILILILGWRYRARKKPRYVYLPMLALLPLVFFVVLLFYRNIIIHLSIWLSLSYDLSTALVFICAGAGFLFLLAMMLLAAQHG
ncbi:MAG: hypothetical protein LBH07_06010 [Treponema sp.]|jgi:hypothetical protein|nr:hypothetical protein [Treponema sp.]